MLETPRTGIIGATGLVGTEMLSILRDRAFPMRSLQLFGSTESQGKTVTCAGEEFIVRNASEADFNRLDLVLMTASGDVSRQFAPKAVKAGAIVIDNTSAFRMDPDVPLIVPEVNADALAKAANGVAINEGALIANPNCTTIITLLAAAPLYRTAGLKRMVICTYQAASGGGKALVEELQQQAHDYAAGRDLTKRVLDKPYLFNVFSHNSPVDDTGYNEEERKVIGESHKILNDDSIAISVTCIRVPTLRSHCVSINLTFDQPLHESEAREILRAAPGVRIVDDRIANTFPEPVDAAGIDDVLVGRIRTDLSQPEGAGLELFVAGDQLRKGAALNAVQIAEALLSVAAHKSA